jgi:hypothetical protein
MLAVAFRALARAVPRAFTPSLTPAATGSCRTRVSGRGGGGSAGWSVADRGPPGTPGSRGQSGQAQGGGGSEVACSSFPAALRRTCVVLVKLSQPWAKVSPMF